MVSSPTAMIRRSIAIVLPVIALLLGWQLGQVQAHRALQQREAELAALYAGSGSELDFSLLTGVNQLLHRHYISPEKLEQDAMLQGAAAGFVGGIGDPYTAFLSPEENKEFQDSLGGNLQGIGAELTVREGQIIVVSPLRGSPAEEAGLQPEDEILTVDGTSVEGMTLSEAVNRIRGQAGTQVTLGIQRKGDNAPRNLSISRREIHIPSVTWEVRKSATGSVGIVTVNQFGDDTLTEFTDALADFRQQNVAGIVVDERFNGGGYLERAVEMVSLLLQQGKVVSVATREGEPMVHYVSGRPMDTTTPLAVVINQGSASAAEIFAGALQDHKRAVIVGKQSFGKGTVQEIFELPGGASLRVTIAKWLTPNGKDLGQHGVTPDIEVERTKEDIDAGKDPQLERAITEVLRKK